MNRHDIFCCVQYFRRPNVYSHMKAELSLPITVPMQNRRIHEITVRERGRLRSFIRRRVAYAADAEDILQEVFFELVEGERLMRPVEQAGAWLFRVARNRITDLFRRRRGANVEFAHADAGDDDDEPSLVELLPSPDAGPEAAYARRLLLEELDAALDDLPEEQREVFIAHEIEGRSFKEMAAETGLSVNTLLSRKRYAVLSLRQRLLAIRNDFLTE